MAVSSRATSSGSNARMSTRAGPLAIPPAALPSLTVAEVDTGFERIGRQAGPGSQAERRRLLAGLLGRATADEQRFLVRLLAGELRQGALEGVMVEATARAAGIPGAEVRRALMLRGALGPVAEAALARGVAGLRELRLQVGRALQPMLAQTATSVEAALARAGASGSARAGASGSARAGASGSARAGASGSARAGASGSARAGASGSARAGASGSARRVPAAVEGKLDGVRVQLHKD